MALRDQPYLPLYIKDILTDEKLILCSAASHGVYLRLLCILHKQEDYGTILLKQNFKQSGSKYINFANLLSKQMPFKLKEIAKSLEEMCDLDVIQITENELSQKRMIRDGKLSTVRAIAGKKGGEKSHFASNFATPKSQANTANANATEYPSVSSDKVISMEDEKKKTKL